MSFQRIARLTLVLVICACAGVTAAVWKASNAADNSSQVARGNELSSCRSVIRSETVDTAVLDSLVLVIDGLAAAFRNDAALRADVDARLPELQAQIAAAISSYQESSRLAVDDPDEFLERCRP